MRHIVNGMSSITGFSVQNIILEAHKNVTFFMFTNSLTYLCCTAKVLEFSIQSFQKCLNWAEDHSQPLLRKTKFTKEMKKR